MEGHLNFWGGGGSETKISKGREAQSLAFVPKGGKQFIRNK